MENAACRREWLAFEIKLLIAAADVVTSLGQYETDLEWSACAHCKKVYMQPNGQF